MKSQTSIILLISLLFGCIRCNGPSEEKPQKVSYAQEKTAILETLNNETKSAFQRDYERWAEHWTHDDDISKTYIKLAESSSSESVGWDEISGFVKAFMEEHPDPEPIPKLLEDIDLRLYNNGAWVSYEQLDSLRGRKRETRLMEKVDGRWRIAAMHTTIYGTN